MSKTTMTDEEFEEMFCRMMADSPKRLVPEDSEDSPEKVKVPAVFDKWYKQVKKASDCYNVEDRAMYLIASQGFGYGVADKDNVLGLDFGFTEEEVCRMREYVDRNKKDAMRAILDGYEVEKQLYRIIFPELSDEYLNYSEATGALWLADEEELGHVKTKFTMDFIEEKIPQYKHFAVSVGFDD